MELKERLAAFGNARIAILGDLCLDAYWTLSPDGSEISVETGLPTRSVSAQRYSLGGAANVVANLAALGVGHIDVLGVVGSDPFGRTLRQLLNTLEVDTSGLRVQDQEWDTPTYIKPLRDGCEANRIDFGCGNQLHDDTAHALIDALRSRIDAYDVVIINQQLPSGVHSEALQTLLQAVCSDIEAARVLIDVRHLAGVYTRGVLKLNDREALALCGHAPAVDAAMDLEATVAAGRQLFAQRGAPVCVSCGAQGCLVVDDSGVTTMPAVEIEGDVDTVGAGDSMTAGLAAALATGASLSEAAQIGALVAGVTVQKLMQTGTATPQEVWALAQTTDLSMCQSGNGSAD